MLTTRQPRRQRGRVVALLAAVSVALAWTLQALFAPTATQAAAAGPAAGATASPPAEPAASGPRHRSLRTHVEPAAPNPTEPLVFEGYRDAPPFEVVPRKQHLTLYPCSTCHKVLPLNTTPRKLVAAPHVADLPHGKGRMWCLTCHQANDRDQLVSLRGQKIDFDRADQQCGQCHGDRHRDWHFGAHGKRAGGWRGERQLYSCTHCHDAHNPVLQPRAPGPPPPLRAGLVAHPVLPHAAPPAEKKP